MNINFIANLSHYVPELVAIVTMIGILFIESATKNSDKNRFMVYFTAVAGLLFSLAALYGNLGDKPVSIFTNAVVVDPFSTLMKMILVGGTLGAIYLSYFSRDIYEDLKSEFVIMAIGVLIGGMLLASANNLLTVYLGVETLSILSYVMASMKRKRRSLN